MSKSPRIQKAIKVATKAHEGQLRKTGEPYITHPLAVMKILQEWNMDEDSIVAGILHDTVEDTELTLKDIEDEFGKNVAFLVNGVTKLGKARSGMKDLDEYLPETSDNLLKLLIATGQDVRVLIIKLADRLHNLRTLSALPPDKQQKIARESLDVFAPLADRLQMGRVRVEIEETSFRYLDPKRYEELKKLTEDRLKLADKKLKNAQHSVESLLKKEHIKYSCDGRVKSIYSLHKKLAKYDQNIDRIYDLIALRFIVEDVTTCYLVLGLIHSLFMPMDGRIKDYIAMPKQNGYQSIHTTVITKDEQVVEFQIRTKEMHDYAERGLAATFYYNEQKLTAAYTEGRVSRLPSHLLWIKELQETATKLASGEKVDTKKLRLTLFADKIFVYTPKGDIIDLPKGSMPLDFAYRLHSEIGAACTGAKINGKMVNLNTKLQSGDIVEILTAKNSQPNPGWLDKVGTKHARHKLLSQLHSLIPNFAVTPDTTNAPKPTSKKEKTSQKKSKK
ncbi:bifunctional (p)ppGpp synthetase/guanosine-3',5'-bis(diphosphate) 3'-pyrophosphohydrolase [Candidatus Saccharibacteria bacterium]|nr:bifunctional (p)ppGpp synthetase/guanosine-3',5'-bis(diphosphate) 3'-pyrophosphohydrolase [Candidatus Saccharibacteria bacterium]MBR3377817.1 bifunctional (p)ppGpp synthetase/guanosine-3',5'-bis(diphosphate) 3'-pyrophosphohydrolase [Candidatus Saccharibacteria bacterium]